MEKVLLNNFCPKASNRKNIEMVICPAYSLMNRRKPVIEYWYFVGEISADAAIYVTFLISANLFLFYHILCIDRLSECVAHHFDKFFLCTRRRICVHFMSYDYLSGVLMSVFLYPLTRCDEVFV